MLRLMEVASQSETFVKLYLEKSKSKNVNRHELFDCPAAGDTLEVFSLDRPPLLAVIPRPSGSRRPFNAQAERATLLLHFRRTTHHCRARWRPPGRHAKNASVYCFQKAARYNGGVDAAARIQSSIAGPIILRNTLPPLASNDLFGGSFTNESLAPNYPVARGKGKH